jgi:hypothetical protein
MLPYFPFRPRFDLAMGTSPLPPARGVVEADEHRAAELALKQQALSTHPSYYFAESEASRAAQHEALALIARDAARLYPTVFSYRQEGESITFQSPEGAYTWHPDHALAPLDWIGRFFQEDFLLLDAGGILRAGQLCFPSGWCLEEKMNKPFLSIHEPLPAVMNPMLNAANAFMQRLRADKPMERTNWGFRLTDQLDLSSRHTAWYRSLVDEQMKTLRVEEVGARVWVRIEHQTLTRLPGGYVLFTIHTFQNPLEQEPLERKQVIESFLKTVPPELIQYKVMDRFYRLLIEYLARAR